MARGDTTLDAIPTTIERRVSFPYILEPQVLRDIVGVVEQAFAELDMKYTQEYVVRFSGSREQRIGSVDQVLQLQNRADEPLTWLLLTFESIVASEGTTQNLARGVYRATVEFTYPYSDFGGINVKVFGPDTRWTDQLMPPLLQQVGRTRNNSLTQRTVARSSVSTGLFLVTLAGAVGVLVLSIVMAIPTSPRANDSGSGEILLGVSPSSISLLTTEEAQELLMSSANATSVEDKLDWLFQSQIALIEKQLEAEDSRISMSLPRARLLGGFLALTAISGLLLFSAFKHYPPQVFYWGDSTKAYDRLVRIRESILGLVVLGLVVALAANMIWLVVSG